MCHWGAGTCMGHAPHKGHEWATDEMACGWLGEQARRGKVRAAVEAARRAMQRWAEGALAIFYTVVGA